MRVVWGGEERGGGGGGGHTAGPPDTHTHTHPHPHTHVEKERLSLQAYLEEEIAPSSIHFAPQQRWEIIKSAPG